MTAALQERWTTFWALVGAAAGAVRRQRRLAVFPVLALLAMATVMAAAMAPLVLPSIVPAGLQRVEWVMVLPRLQRHWPLWGLGMWYLGYVSLTFWAVALTSAALEALRDDTVSLRRAVGFALGRLPAILGFALVAATLGAALSSVERRSQWLVRAFMAVTGLSWTLVSLFAITAMTGEKLGTIDAFRRGTRLLRASWAEGRLGPLGLGLLWVPLIALEAVVLWLASAEVYPAVFVAALALNLLVWASFWLLERVYAAAVYCYAVEGVVPGPFRGERLDGVWQAVALATPPLPEAAPLILPLARLRERRRQRVATWVGVIVVVGFFTWRLSSSGLVAGLFPGAGLTGDQINFPPGPRRQPLRHVYETPAGLSAIAAVPTAQGPRVFLFGRRNLMKLDGHLDRVLDVFLPPSAASMEKVEALALGSEGGVLLGTSDEKHTGDAVVALDWEGRFLFRRKTPTADAVDALVPVRTPSGWGVAVGYNGSYGLCFIDNAGEEKWCNRDVGNVWVVSSLDCDADGQEEILSVSPSAHGAGAPLLGCFSLDDGRHLGDIPVAREPYVGMRAVDLDGDGRKEIAYAHAEWNDSVSFGAWRGDGAALTEAQVASEGGHPWRTGVPLAVARAQGRDLVVLGPRGQLLGLGPSGRRWSAGQDFMAVAALDLDQDGNDEIITLGKLILPDDQPFQNVRQLVNVWSWTAPQDQERR